MTTTDRRLGLNSSAAIKVPCRVATTANITLSGEQTIDGVAVVDGDRVLVKNQTTASENGIYECDTSTWQRTKDWDGTYDVRTGTLTYVFAGTANSGWWYVSTTGTITVGTTSVTIAQASTALAVISAFSQTLIDDADADAFIETLADGATAETAPATGDLVLLSDVSANDGRKMTLLNLFSVVNTFTAETDLALDDKIPFYDTSATAIRTMTPDNIFKGINLLTEDTAPDATADYLLSFDASSTSAKKILPNRLAATQTQMEAAASNDAFVTPGRQHLHAGHPKATVIMSVLTTTPTVTALYNSLGTLVSSRTSSGTYKLYWDTALTNPIPQLTARSSSTALGVMSLVPSSGMSSTSIQIIIHDHDGAREDPEAVYICLWGDTT